MTVQLVFWLTAVALIVGPIVLLYLFPHDQPHQ